jgi:multiple sugar transport system ATP-binding protein
MATLELRGIRKSFGSTPVLEGVSARAADGQFVSLLGASGSGKSTLLRIIAGLETADAGQVLVDGRDVSALSPKDRDIAMVFQSYALYPHMTVRENIGLGLKLRGASKEEVQDRVRDAAQMLGLSALLDRKPSALSGGQRQRAALARCLVRRPKLFLLDEPLSNLDAVLRERTRGELKLLFRRVKGTVVYVTHDQVEAMTMSDRVVVLDRGRVQQDGAPEELYRRPANEFVAAFLGSPSMNIIEGGAAGSAGLIAPPEIAARLGIRPEDLRVAAEPFPGAVRAAVTLAEPTGAHTVLTLDIGGLALRALAPGSWDAARPEAFVAAPREAWHFFDPRTGLRLEPQNRGGLR